MTVRTTHRKALLVTGIAAALLATACTVAPAENEAVVHQAGYIVFRTERVVKDCVDPGTTATQGLGDEYFTYPTRDISYEFSNSASADGPPVTIIKDNIPLVITGVVTFNMKTDCDSLKEFHKKVGSKPWGPDNMPAYISTGDGETDYRGWEAMLDTIIGQAVQSSTTAASSKVKEDYLAIYNGAGRAALEAETKQQLPAYAETLTTGAFFQNFRVTINKPTIERQDVLDAIASKSVAKLQNEAQLEKNAAITTEIEGIKALVKVLGADGYNNYVKNQLTRQQVDILAQNKELLKQAIADGRVQIMMVPDGTTAVAPR